MKISELWLRSILDPKISLEEIVAQLTHAGIEVDDLDPIPGAAENTVMSLKIPANRGDCLSMEGVLREIAVLNNLPFNGIEVSPCFAKISDTFPVKVEASEACPQYVGRIIQNVQANTPTPAWMQTRLEEAGVRCVSVIVDISNYVMLELGQPLHGFDLAKLDKEIVVRYAVQGERLVTLDGQDVSLNPQTLVIADSQKPLAIAGLIGGMDSSITESTRTVFLESAYFDPIKIRSTSKGFNIRTESSHRFERGVDPQLQERAIERATQLIVDIVGGNPGPVTEQVNPNYLPKIPKITLRLSKIQAILGICPKEESVAILTRLGMKVDASLLGWEVSPPSFRVDITNEVDLIEEIARIVGYDQIPSVSPSVSLTFPNIPEDEIAEIRFKTILVDRGYHEAITYSFISPEFDRILTPSTPSLTLKNPISEDLAVMRSSLWPGLLKAVQYNQRRQYSRLRLFETGLCFLQSAGGLDQKPYLGGVAVGTSYPEQWGEKSRPLDFYDVKSDVEALLALTGRSDVGFEPAECEALHPGQTAKIRLGKTPIGYLGALHPAILQSLELQGPVFLFELDLRPLQQRAIPRFQELSKYPSVRRDIALLIDQSVLAEQVKSVIVNCVGSLIRDIFIFDIYQGKGIEPGRKSIALGLILQHPSRTLVEAEVNELVQKVVKELSKKYQAVLRE